MKRYQAVAFLLSTAMTVSSVAPVFGASNDVFGHWAEFTITKWQNEGRIGGYEDGTFKPDKSITRAEFVRLLNSAVPTAFTSSSSVNFSDVKESDWFFADVSKAVGSGVTSGFEDGTFRPGETVTRTQAAVFIAKAKGLTPNEAAADNFTDAASIPAWAKGAVGAAVSAGYLSGYPDGSFGGSKGMTRAEAVSTLDRVLGGTSTSNQTPSTGEVDTTDRDSQEKEDTTTTANAGDMVWTSGGSGGGRRSSSSSSGGGSSSSSNTVNGAVTIRSQSDANDYKGKVLTGKATIYAKDGLELNDIKFKGDVDIIADSTATAAAYIDGDTAVAAAYLSNINIYFEGRTNISGTITVIRDGVPASTQVIIRTRTPRAISAMIRALVPTRIIGFEVPRVEAKAPVEVAKDAKVGTVTADDGASVVAEGDVDNVNVVGKVDNIELSGTGSTDVTVDDGASVEKIDVKDDVKANVEVNGNAEVKNVAVSGNASAGVDVKDNATVGNVAVSDSAAAKVDVKDTAKVEKVDIADSATANVDVAPEAKVDKVTSTSTAAGSSVTGTGEVGKIESTNPGTLDKGEEVTTPVETPPATDDGNTGGDTPTITTITASDIEKVDFKVTAPTAGANATAKVEGTVTGATLTTSKWKDAKGTEATTLVKGTAYTATVTLTAGDNTVFDSAIKTVNVGGNKVDVTVSTDGKTLTFTVSETATESSTTTPDTASITGVTAKVDNKVVENVTVSKDASNKIDANVVIALEATVEKAAEGASIVWTLPNDLKDNANITLESTNAITEGKAAATLTIKPDYVTAVAKELTITAAYKESASANASDTIKNKVTIQLVPKGEEANTVGSVVIGEVKAVDLTASTTNAEQTITATVKNAATEPAPMSGQTVTWTLSGANSADTKLSAVTAAGGGSANTPSGQANDITATSTTGTNGEPAQIKLVVGEDETATSLTLTAAVGNKKSEAKTITVTPKPVAAIDETHKPADVVFEKADATTATKDTTIKVKNAALKAGALTNDTDIVFNVTKQTNANDSGTNPQTNDSGLTFTAANDTTDSTNHTIKVTVTKGSAVAGKYDVEATIKNSAFVTGSNVPATDGSLKATFTVEVKGDETPIVTLDNKAATGQGTATDYVFTAPKKAEGEKPAENGKITSGTNSKITATTKVKDLIGALAVKEGSDVKNTGYTIKVKIGSGNELDSTSDTALGEGTTNKVVVKVYKNAEDASGNAELVATYDVTIGEDNADANTIKSIALTGLDTTDIAKIVQDGQTSAITIGTNTTGIETGTGKVVVKWYQGDQKGTYDSSEVSTFTATKYYKASVTLEASNGKAFKTGFATTDITGLDASAGEIKNVSVTAADTSASTAAKVSFDIEFTAPAAKAEINNDSTKKLSIYGLTAPTGEDNITASNVKAGTSASDTDLKYEVPSTGGVSSKWTKVEENGKVTGYTCDVKLAITDVEKTKYKFKTDDIALDVAGIFNDGTMSAVVKTGTTASESEVTFTITYSPENPSSDVPEGEENISPNSIEGETPADDDVDPSTENKDGADNKEIDPSAEETPAEE